MSPRNRQGCFFVGFVFHAEVNNAAKLAFSLIHRLKALIAQTAFRALESQLHHLLSFSHGVLYHLLGIFSPYQYSHEPFCASRLLNCCNPHSQCFNVVGDWNEWRNGHRLAYSLPQPCWGVVSSETIWQQYTDACFNQLMISCWSLSHY